MSAPSTTAPPLLPPLPPLQNGDRMNAAEFLRRWEAMPQLKKAELIDGTVFIASEQIHRLIDPNVPPLENGDNLTYAEFERRWDNMPDLKKAELIDGVVYMPPPVSAGFHGMPQSDLDFWVALYRVRTPGTDQATDSTLRLDNGDAPQPDAALFISQTNGGGAWLDGKGYLRGAPELVAEVAASTVSYDLHQKLEVYRRAGVGEYLVYRTVDRTVDWFALSGGEYHSIPRGPDGTLRSLSFPGLWLDPDALVRRDIARVMSVLEAGLASPEHAVFVETLRRAVSP